MSAKPAFRCRSCMNSSPQNTTRFATSSNSRFFVGIDSGGTKSHLVIWTAEQMARYAQVMASEQELLQGAVYDGRFQGINLDVIDEYTATQRLSGIFEAAANALRIPTSVFLQQSEIVMGLAGLDTPSDKERADLWFRSVVLQFGLLRTQYTLLPDVELALWSASPHGVGVVLIAGTGSNCYGQDRVGHRAKTGGMSHFFSDEGGGFMLGWEALHTMNKMHDGRMEKTLLYDEVLRMYSVPNFAALKTLVVTADDYKHIVAQAAPAVQKLSAQGEPHSQHIVAQAIEELQRMVSTVVAQLDYSQDMYVYLVGSLFKDDFYRQQLTARLYSEGIRSQPMRIEAPVGGVVNWRRGNP